MEYQIEKGEYTHKKIIDVSKTPLKQIQVGENFLTDLPPMNLRASVNYYGYKSGKKFKVKKEGNGSRVFRIK